MSKPENPKGKITKWFSLETQGLLETEQQSGAFMRSCLSFFCFIKKLILSADYGDVYWWVLERGLCAISALLEARKLFMKERCTAATQTLLPQAPSILFLL